MSQNQVIVLQSGYSHADEEEPGAMRANCSCTLIRCRDGTNIIVDTLTAWDGEHLLRLLSEVGLQPQDINVVVCTHGHSDHIGCNYLFQQARLHLVGACASHKDLYFDHFGGGDKDEKYSLDKHGEVVVQRTPGHTLSCVSVIVHNTALGTVGVCGDLFERQDDVADASIWQNAGSEDGKQQCTERLRMAQLCAHIVPGHGPMFAVTDELRSKLEADALNLILK
ncbi:metallo-beta-lactamase domain-containing protein 1 [Scaptodrosophila lebanonensis]|uniref:Metallo-beta-lactamase domain-containing protein 1 n=1 Tax=Drosophila lebanonensis TaxID=7225 RepID=A0A6J2TMD8_DROLE|nr:metallo-beta-lactamase domain-containing protein 1 [Scaptodrosophila lebanonensis]